MIRNFFNTLFLLLLLTLTVSCENEPYELPGQTTTDSNEQLLQDVAFLSADSLEGRRTGTEGNRIAREYIIQRFDSLNLSPINNSFEQVFENPLAQQNPDLGSSKNIIGMVEGSSHPDEYILVTAHYDHLGVENGEIYNGADDNASGVAGLLAAAKHFASQSPDHSILFIAFDAEEEGLAGARYFTENPPFDLDKIRLVVNLDMISVDTDNRLIASGTANHPFTKPIVESVSGQTSLDIVFGYDTDTWPQNWTFSSDHGPFHRKGVPYIYFGVEDHEHYHQPSDTFENIDHQFFTQTVGFILNFLEAADDQL